MLTVHLYIAYCIALVLYCIQCTCTCILPYRYLRFCVHKRVTLPTVSALPVLVQNATAEIIRRGCLPSFYGIKALLVPNHHHCVVVLPFPRRSMVPGKIYSTYILFFSPELRYENEEIKTFSSSSSFSYVNYPASAVSRNRIGQLSQNVLLHMTDIISQYLGL